MVIDLLKKVGTYLLIIALTILWIVGKAEEERQGSAPDDDTDDGNM